MRSEKLTIKILTLSAYYPPFNYGGYENRVRDVMDGLAARGHQVSVLTTQPDKTIRIEAMLVDYPVIRKLNGTRKALGWAEQLTTKESTNRLGVAIVFLRHIWRDMHDLRLIDETIKTYQPDIIYLGNMFPLTRSLIPFLAFLPIPLILDDGGKTMEMVYTDHGLWYRFLAEFQPKSAPLIFIYQLFISLISTLSGGRLKKEWTWPERISAFFNNRRGQISFLKRTIPFKSTRLIQSGLNLDKFSFRTRSVSNSPLYILVPGRIEPTKGQLDAVRLSALLKREGIEHLLTIVGGNWKPEYRLSLINAVADLDLINQVNFLPNQERNALIKLYQQAEICFFPSYNKTGFSRIPLEAMASGCVLFSYGGESSDEIIQNGENGFLVPPGAIEEVCEIICSLANDADKMEQIAISAREFVEQNHSMTGYLNQIEAFLYEVIDQKAEK